MKDYMPVLQERIGKRDVVIDQSVMFKGIVTGLLECGYRVRKVNTTAADVSIIESIGADEVLLTSDVPLAIRLGSRAIAINHQHVVSISQEEVEEFLMKVATRNGLWVVFVDMPEGESEL